MYVFDGVDMFVNTFYKGILNFSSYEILTDKYGKTKGFTITLLGFNFNFIKRVK